MRCSGEKIGCARCQNLGLECQYSESRVGKVPGIRAKKNQATQRSTSWTTTTSTAEIAPSTQVTHGPQPDMPDTALPNTPDPSVLSWTGEFDYSGNNDLLDMSCWADGNTNDRTKEGVGVGVNIGVTLSNPGTGTTVTSPGDNPFFEVGQDSSLPSMSPAPITQSDANQQQSNSILDSPYMNRPQSRQRSQVDSQCVLACIQIISSLENYILTGLRSEDLILEACRCAANQVNTLVDMQKDSPSIRCVALFSTVLHQLLELLEVGHSAILAEGSGNGLGLQSALSTKLKGFGRFGFGGYTLDAEEQLALKARRMAKELQHCMDILRKVSALTPAGSGIYSRRLSVADRDWCFNELMSGMNNLYTRLCNNAA